MSELSSKYRIAEMIRTKPTENMMIAANVTQPDCLSSYSIAVKPFLLPFASSEPGGAP
jgi:hypothetical protein